MKKELDYYLACKRVDMQALAIQEMLKVTYWAKDISLAEVRNRLEDGLVFGVFFRRSQIGFLRLANRKQDVLCLADLVIHPDHRKKGLARALLTYALAHLEERKLLVLSTRHAFALYQSFGFMEARKTEADPDDSKKIRDIWMFRLPTKTRGTYV